MSFILKIYRSKEADQFYINPIDTIKVKMEEEEDTNSPKKQRRKRKPRKDLSPEPTTPADWEEDNNGEEKKRKRGRKKKKIEPVPEPEEELTDLQQAFQVVEQLMSFSGAAAFLDRPDDSMYGMSDYYEVITKPMWLREVQRKYEDKHYLTATDLVMDVRLILENCYQYWGPCDTLSKRALKLEQLFETKLTSLPPDLQKQCSLEATHGDMVKEEPDETTSKKSNGKKGGFVSKLLDWVMSGKGRSEDTDKPANAQENLTKIRRAEREAAERQLALWESEHLLDPTTQEQIVSMWEFPVIGQFLHLVYKVLNIDPISHLELERMMLMPQASKTLATLITSMLIPPLFRAKLEVGPAMPYSIWTRRLHTKVAHWYRSYHGKGDSTVEVQSPQAKVLNSLGIEPQFWLVMGEDNPLADYQFHELSFLQRVWLLKGLCDFLLHNHKTIQDCINNLEMEELREMNLGRDKEGYSYHYFPMFTEVRIYKMAKVSDAKWKDYAGGVDEAITMCAEEEDDEDQSPEQNLIGFSRRPLHKPPRSMRPSHSDFKLVCQSLEDVRCMVDNFCDADPLLLQGQGVNAPLVSSLQSIISDLESRESKMELGVFNVRSRMRDEWKQFKDRSADYVDPGLAYWERKEKEEKRGEDKPSDLGIPGSSSDNTLPDEEKRERRTRRESSWKMLCREENGAGCDESAEESPLDFDDDSEDEWYASKKDKENKKKKRCMSAKKMKKLAEMSNKTQQSEKLNLNSTFNSSVQSDVKLGGQDIDAIKIKQELPDPDDTGASINTKASKPPKQHSNDHIKPNTKAKSKNKLMEPIICKQEIIEENQSTATTPSNHTSVIQTLVPPVNLSNVKMEKASKPTSFTPDLSTLKRSNSPDADVVYISDSEDPADIKPSPAMLAQRVTAKTVETINYAVPQQAFLVPTATQNQAQFLPINVAPADQVYNPQGQVFNVTQQPAQPIAFQMPTAQTIVQQPLIRPNPTIVRLQGTTPRQTLGPNQKFVVIQPNANVNQPGQFMSKSPRAQGSNFPTTPTMQSVNWFSPRGSPQSNYSPRQRSPSLVVVQGQSPRGRGSPRSPMTPTRGQRFSGRTPPNTTRTPTSVIRTPQMGARTPSPMRGRGGATPVRGGPVRNLNFNRSPAKPVAKPANEISPMNDSPDIEGTLVVSLTDSGGFGYAVMLPDGGKISLTQDQLAKIRSDNGGTLPKTCKVPLNMQTEGFRID